MREVPKSWTFPKKVVVKVLWDLWWLGNKEVRIRPYRHLLKSCIQKTETKAYCQAKKVINILTGIMTDKNLLEGEICTLSITEHDEIFTAAYRVMFEEFTHHINYFKCRRKEEVSYITVYGFIMKAKAPPIPPHQLDEQLDE